MRDGPLIPTAVTLAKKLQDKLLKLIAASAADRSARWKYEINLFQKTDYFVDDARPSWAEEEKFRWLILSLFQCYVQWDQKKLPNVY